MMIEYIVVLVFGLLLGNFATTILYRLPRGIVMYGFNQESTQPPFCSLCHHKLEFYEYLPVLSWFSTFGKCNYCGQQIPYSYIILEIFTALLSLYCFYLFGEINDHYLLLLGLGVSAALSSFIHLEHKAVSKVMTVSIVFWGAIYQTFINHTIINWLGTLAMASCFSLFLLKNTGFHDKERHDFIHVLLPASIWCSGESMILYGCAVAIFYIFRKWLRRDFHFYPWSMLGLFLVVLLQN